MHPYQQHYDWVRLAPPQPHPPADESEYDNLMSPHYGRRPAAHPHQHALPQHHRQQPHPVQRLEAGLQNLHLPHLHRADTLPNPAPPSSGYAGSESSSWAPPRTGTFPPSGSGAYPGSTASSATVRNDQHRFAVPHVPVPDVPGILHWRDRPPHESSYADPYTAERRPPRTNSSISSSTVHPSSATSRTADGRLGERDAAGNIQFNDPWMTGIPPDDQPLGRPPTHLANVCQRLGPLARAIRRDRSRRRDQYNPDRYIHISGMGDASRELRRARRENHDSIPVQKFRRVSSHLGLDWDQDQEDALHCVYLRLWRDERLAAVEWEE
ncbi:MAG: hypothetical protein Q9159_007168 [Coniocarpon cinnabarinum]